MTTSIIINVTEAGTDKKRKRSVTNINPKATNEQLKTFARQMVQLTTSSYVDTDRVDKINVDSEESKQYRDITLENVGRNQTVTMQINVEKNKTASPLVIYNTGGSINYIDKTPSGYTDESNTRQIITFQIPNSGGTLYIGLSENDNFYATFVKETIN